ncbi:hypothetical protein [Hymenobacter psychrophilus]|uniref:Uncharacterized protein n=1 Tax=Hymenobacter psychrophilus TaxID=651662 RepID=A0A1H3PDG4_9BACT|nr:hypothetical protein [Hymenobacter psychrophilus]SDY99107.1 hypothetical protein SAMN04488069_1297 [Hymenobacter psychrophilus]
MSRPGYYGRPGGLKHPFGSSGKKPRVKSLPLPRLPSRKMLIGSLCQHLAKEHMETDCGPWSKAAFDVWWWLSDIRDKHARHAA